MVSLNIISFLTWFVPLVFVIVGVAVVVAFYGIIKHFGNCPACGRKISNGETVCSFCGTARLSKLKPVVCPSCNKEIFISLSQQGKVVECPYCRRNVTPAP